MTHFKDDDSDCPSILQSQKLDDAYLELVKDTRIYEYTLAQSASLIAKQCACALSASHASIWVGNADETGMNCLSMYGIDSDTYDSGAIFEKKSHPNYFQALSNERVIDAQDAQHDPRTLELANPYLISLDIRSLLDAPIRHQGKLQGVIRVEMRGSTRRWTKEEQLFVASIADLVSQLFIVDELAKSEIKYQGLFESTTEGICIFGGEVFMDVNPAMCKIFRGEHDELIGKSPIDLSPEFQNDGRPSAETAMGYVMACLQGTPQNFEWTHKRLDGTTFPADVTLNQIRIAEQDTLFAITRDITEKKEAENITKKAQVELEFRAGHDSLTGLLNRDKLHEYVSKIIEEPTLGSKSNSADDAKLALLLLDLNRFKEINDTLGHETGDKVLINVADILNREVNTMGGDLFRLGGDEFVAVFAASSCTEPLETVDRTLHASLKKSICVDDITMEMSASIGIALHPQNGKDSHELLRCADVAMYHAKKTDGMSSLYNSENDSNNKRRLAMMVELGSAIRDDELTLHFQPRIQTSTGNITGCEALVRWNHKSLGLVPPNEFLPLAEMGELIHPLTDWVLVNVIKNIKHHQSLGRHIPIAMNISARNLHDSNMVDRIESLLDEENIPAELLEIEITESALINHPQLALNNLNRLDALGVSIAIDDFGTGYSSLSYLKQLPVNTLKIDQSFVKDMLTDESDAVIVDSTIALAHNFSLTVVAEGVEDEATLEALGLKNCEQAQGYFIARPMPAEAFDDWLNERYPTELGLKRAA